MKVAAAIKKLNQAAAVFGGHVEDDSDGQGICLQVCAPDGKHWVESGGPHLVVFTYAGPQSWLDDAVTDGLERIAEGVCEAGDEPDDE